MVVRYWLVMGAVRWRDGVMCVDGWVQCWGAWILDRRSIMHLIRRRHRTARAATGANTAWLRAYILESLDLYTLAGVRASGSGRGSPRVIQYRFYMFYTDFLQNL